MSLADYFETTKGIGVLGTANAQGNVDTALYGRPHFIDDDTVAFIMNDRLSYQNVQSNPNAAYMFIEQAEGYAGKRLYLTKTKESDDPELIASLRRTEHGAKDTEPKTKHLVYFKITRIRPLVGG